MSLKPCVVFVNYKTQKCWISSTSEFKFAHLLDPISPSQDLTITFQPGTTEIFTNYYSQQHWYNDDSRKTTDWSCTIFLITIVSTFVNGYSDTIAQISKSIWFSMLRSWSILKTDVSFQQIFLVIYIQQYFDKPRKRMVYG